MKRLLCMLCCVALLLAALPAAAYTGKELLPIGLTMRVMEPQTDILGRQIFTEPAPGRRYVRNEVLAVMIGITVPAGMDPLQSGQTALRITIQGGDIHIPENFPGGMQAAPVLHYGDSMPPELQAGLLYPQDGFSISLGSAADASAFYNAEEDRVYSVAFFYKLTAESSTITATLSGGGFAPDASDLHKSHLQLDTELGEFAITRNSAPMIIEGAAYTNKAVYTIEDVRQGSRFLLIAGRDTDRVEDLLLAYRQADGGYAAYRMILAQGQPCFVLASPIWSEAAPLMPRAEGAGEEPQAYLQLLSTYDSLVRDTFRLDWVRQAYAQEALLAAPLLQEDAAAELVVNAG